MVMFYLSIICQKKDILILTKTDLDRSVFELKNYLYMKIIILFREGRQTLR